MILNIEFLFVRRYFISVNNLVRKCVSIKFREALLSVSGSICTALSLSFCFILLRHLISFSFPSLSLSRSSWQLQHVRSTPTTILWLLALTLVKGLDDLSLSCRVLNLTRLCFPSRYNLLGMLVRIYSKRRGD